MTDAIIDRILEVFTGRAEKLYSEAITQRQHALQCASLAERAGATPQLVAAAFLHDIGHLLHELGEDPAEHGIDDQHESVGADWLARHFVPAAVAPVRLHVAAKRYLTATKVDYFARLSPASVRSLELQGGPMSAAEVAAYDAVPYARDSLRLRTWDEAAKDPAAVTPPIQHYRTALVASLA